MKHSPLLFSALVPLMAVAVQADAADKGYDQLRNDVPVTEIIGSDVNDRNGENIGEVEEVIFDRKGSVKSVLVELADEDALTVVTEERDVRVEGEEGEEYSSIWGNTDDEQMRPLSTTDSVRDDQNRMPRVGARTERNLEQTAGYDDNDSPEEVSGYAFGEMVEIAWSDVEFNPSGATLEMNSDLPASSTIEDADTVSQGGIRASRLVGMEVNLADDASFGEVEDVLINRESGTATAFLVDSMDYFDKKTFALPARIDSVDSSHDEVNYEYTESQVEALGEFELEALTERT